MGKLKQFIDHKSGYFVHAVFSYFGEPDNYKHSEKEIFSNFITVDGLKSIINKVEPYKNVAPISATFDVYDYYKTTDNKEYLQANRTLHMNKNQCQILWLEMKSKNQL